MKFLRRNPSWLIYLPIVAVPLLLFGVPLAQGKVLYWGTAGLQFVPWREFACTQLDQGVLPLWNPLNGMGAPLIANYQLAFFYPPGWLTIIGHWLAGAQGVAWVYTLLVPIHLAWGGFGMVLLLRSLGVKPVGQVISGLAFAATGYLVARASFYSMIWTGAWMGWILWAASGIGSPFSSSEIPRRYFWLGIFSGLMLLAGHAQLSWYILLFAGAWTTIGAWSNAGFKRAVISLLKFIGLVMIGILLAGIQLAPTFEYLQQSQRADAYDYALAMTYSYWPWRLLTFLNPDLFGNPGLGDYWGYAAYWEDAGYIGVIPLFLGLSSLGLLFSRREHPRRRGILFLWGMALAGLLLSLGDNTPIFPWLFKHVPTFDLFQAPARWMIWPVAALCIESGIMADEWSRPAGRRLRRIRLSAAGFSAVMVGAGIGSLLIPELKPGLMRGFMIFGGLGAVCSLLLLVMPESNNSHRHSWWYGVVLAVLSLDLLGNNLFINPFISADFFSPEAVAADQGPYQGRRIFISAADEYALKFEKYFRFADTRTIAGFNEIRKDMIPNLNLLNGIDSANNFDPIVPGRFAVWMTEINEIEVDKRDAYLAFMGVTEVIQKNEAGGTQLRQLTLPAAAMVKSYSCVQLAYNGQTALWETLEKIDRREDPECIIIEAAGTLVDEEYADKVQISIVETGFQKLEFRIDNEKPTWLRIGVTWFPGWQAFIDGEQVQLYRADYLFSAISTPSGSHEVTLVYRPFSFYFGTGLTCAGIIGSVILAFWQCRKSRSEDRQN